MNTVIFLYLVALPVVWVVVGIVVAYHIYDALSRVPERYRAAPPYFAWLTLIPIAGAALYWILLPFKVPESFQRYFSEHPNKTDRFQDCGRRLGLACVILGLLSLIPLVNIIAFLPALIVLILYLRRITAMAKLVPWQMCVPSHRSAIEPDPSQTLTNLKRLLDEGVLTHEEYQAQKQKILGPPAAQ